MRIEESKNLKYDKFPWADFIEGHEKFPIEKCFLENFSRINDKINLHFKNSSQAIIKATSIEGGREIDMIEEKLNDFLEKSYEEILDADF